jgi:hypothetical protein
LRTVFNAAVSQGFVSEMLKPFKDIQTGSTSNLKLHELLKRKLL